MLDVMWPTSAGREATGESGAAQNTAVHTTRHQVGRVKVGYAPERSACQNVEKENESPFPRRLSMWGRPLPDNK